jgi:hypothetical protein
MVNVPLLLHVIAWSRLRPERPLDVRLAGLTCEDPDLCLKTGEELLQQPCLADPGLAREQGDLRLPLLRDRSSSRASSVRARSRPTMRREIPGRATSIPAE